MRISRWPSLLSALVVSVLVGSQPLATAATNHTNKVIVYPGPQESLRQLQKQGFTNATDYGAYWLVEASDAQAASLARSHGDRAVKSDYLNVIELESMALDTAKGAPAIPSSLRELAPANNRLRLVQFKGPVLPEWLGQLKAAGAVRIISYIPNNTYLVRLDAAAEQALQGLLVPNGPIQWIGVYQPYYKIKSTLQSVAAGPVDVRVAVLAGSTAAATLQSVQQFALKVITPPRVVGQQQVVVVRVEATAVPQIAQMPDVLWIEPVQPASFLDEKQDLIVATATNGPGHGPVAGVGQYLSFLTNTVGFSTIPEQYPIIDMADSGLDNGTVMPYHPDFYEAPNPTVVQLIRGFAGDFALPPTRIAYNDGVDLIGHGTLGASIAVGLSTQGGSETIHLTTLGEASTTPLTNFVFVFPCVTNQSIVCSNNICVTNVSFEGCTVTNITFLTNCVTETDPVTLGTLTNAFPINITKRDANGFQFGQGVSPFGRMGASLIFGSSAAGGTPDPVFEVINAYLRRARIGNNSWHFSLVIGQNDGVYDSNSQTYDQLVRDAVDTGSTNTPAPFPLNQEFIVVFAGGNDNGVGSAGGFGDVLVTPPATAKNVITVGATENVRPGDGCLQFPSDEDNSLDISFFNSFGPTRDGRFKPEIVAPGSSIWGALSQGSYVLPIGRGPDPNNPLMPANLPPVPCLPEVPVPLIQALYTCNSGTSFAAPAVSGGMQLLWWYFQNRLNQLQPSPAMAKAYLCNSARYLPTTNPLTQTTDTLPSISQGMGEMDLQRMFDGVPRVLRDESTPRAIDTPLISTNPVPQQTFFSRTGQTYELSGTVFDATKPFRVTLAWTDAPGDPNAFKQLVNDLDLEITIGGQTYKGNVFNQDHSVPGGNADDLNNMESVFLPAGQTGTWSIVVRAMNIAGNGVPNVGNDTDQDFALVVYNAIAQSDQPHLGTNDTCQTAQVIASFPFAASIMLTNSLYSDVLPSPSAGRGGIEAFWKISHPLAGTTFTADSSASGIETVLSAWKGTCGALVEVISKVVSSNAPGPISFVVDGTSDYYVVVDGHNNAMGPVSLAVTSIPAAITVTPSSINFGTQPVGTTSSPRTVVVSNNGPTPLTVTGVALAGINPGDFAISGNACTGQTLLPGSSCGLSVTFKPTAVLTSAAELRISSTDPLNPIVVVQLTGTGVAGTAAIDSIPNAIVGLDFGDVLVGTTSSNALSLVILNKGSTALVITDTAIVGPNSNEFAFATNACQGATLLAGGSCTLSLTFSPDSAGPMTANVAVNSTVGNLLIPLSGNGVLPPSVLSFTPGSLSFGSQLLGTTSAVQSITVFNTGAASVPVNSATIVGVNPSDFLVVNNGCGTLAPSNSCAIGVAFAPTAAGGRTGGLRVSFSGQGSPASFPLTGTGVVPAPRVCLSTGDSLSFASLPLGTSASQNLILTNCGSASLTISTLTISGAAVGDFTASGCAGGSLAPGATCTIPVTFTPTAVGLRQAILSITDSAADSPQSVLLSGTGTPPAPEVCLSRSSIFFSNQPPGTISPPQSVIITNCGLASLVVSNVAITGAGAGAFVVDSNSCGLTPILPGHTCAIGVRFAPGTTGGFNATLVLNDGAPDSPQTVALSGVGGSSQPDLLIGKSPEAINKSGQIKNMIGGGIFSADGTGQTLTFKVGRGKTKKFYIAIQNAGSVSDVFRLLGERSSQDISAQFFLGAKGGQSLTAGLASGAFSTSTLAAGAFTGNDSLVRLEITVAATAVRRSTNSVLVTATSGSDLTKQDAVKAVVIVN